MAATDELILGQCPPGVGVEDTDVRGSADTEVAGVDAENSGRFARHTGDGIFQWQHLFIHELQGERQQGLQTHDTGRRIAEGGELGIGLVRLVV